MAFVGGVSAGLGRGKSGRVCRTSRVGAVISVRAVLQDGVEGSDGEVARDSFGFQSLGMSGELASCLETSGIKEPMPVQTKTIPAIYGGVDVVIGAATGSGKTLAYLLPVVQMLKDAEVLHGVVRRPRRPRAICLVPTRELAEQVLKVAKDIAHKFKFRAVGLVGGTAGLKKQAESLGAAPPDLLIATTGRMLQHLEARNFDLVDVQHVIIDEVDTLLEGGFGSEMEKILAGIRKRKEEGSKTQFIAAGATHPPSAMALYQKFLPSARFINVDLHRPPPGLTQRFILTTSGEKTKELVSLFGEAENDGSLRGGRIIVFANTTESCRFVDHFLVEKGFSTSCIHGEMPTQKRAENFKAFADRKTQVLVGTDIAARGLDNLSIDHVVLFDFPTSAVDYIHRAGRTARANAKGRVTSFVTKKDRTLADAIQEADRERVDTIEKAVKKRRESDKRKADERRLNTLRIEKEEKKQGRPPRSRAQDDKGTSNQGKNAKTRVSPKRR